MALPEFTAIAELEFPELHDESIPTLTFAKAVQGLLAASGIRDFMLKVPRKPNYGHCSSAKALSAVLSTEMFVYCVPASLIASQRVTFRQRRVRTQVGHAVTSDI